MRILVFLWRAYSNRYLVNNLARLGNEVDTYEDDRIIKEDESGFDDLLSKIKRGYDVVVTYNYFKYVAIACSMCGTPYISWTQDSPMLSLFDASTYFKTNYFFCFDSEQAEGLRKRGIKNAYYYPLLVDCNEMYNIATHTSEEEKLLYSSDISFVGSLYSEKNMLSEIGGLPEYIKGYIDGFEETQIQIPAVRFSQMSIAGNVIGWLKDNFVFNSTEESSVPYMELMDNLIDREVTVKERRKMLEIMKGRDFRLYTMSDTQKYPYINNCGTVDYYTQMPKVFALTKINLNLTLRSIRTGIPLRVLDVLACGGFLLTNAQDDLFTYFEEGRSIVTFANLDEMAEKLTYYLKYSEERERIAKEGQTVVKDCFDYQKRLGEMFEVVGVK